MWPERAQPVHQAGARAGQETAEDAIVRPVQPVAPQLDLAARVEQAQFDMLGMFGEHRDVDATVARLRTHRVRSARGEQQRWRQRIGGRRHEVGKVPEAGFRRAGG